MSIIIAHTNDTNSYSYTSKKDISHNQLIMIHKYCSIRTEYEMLNDNFEYKYYSEHDNIDTFRLCELSKLYSTNLLFDSVSNYMCNKNIDTKPKCDKCNVSLNVYEIIYYDHNSEAKLCSSGYNCAKHWCECMSNIESTPWSYLRKCSNCNNIICKTCKSYNDQCEYCSQHHNNY
jgi:hypothetical protein